MFIKRYSLYQIKLQLHTKTRAFSGLVSLVYICKCRRKLWGKYTTFINSPPMPVFPQHPQPPTMIVAGVLLTNPLDLTRRLIDTIHSSYACFITGHRGSEVVARNLVYIGCYIDKIIPRQLGGPLRLMPTNTPDKCIAACCNEGNRHRYFLDEASIDSKQQLR